MTPEAQRIAIAEACGWFAGYGSDGMRFVIPDYVTDLNAMHEAEKMLSPAQRTGELSFMCHLKHITIRDTSKAPEWFNLIHATAAQRAEAFLRVTGRWDSSR